MGITEVALGNSEDVEAFYGALTGEPPKYMQLSEGALDLRMKIVDLGNLSLVWAKSNAREVWQDAISEGFFHFGLLLDSARPCLHRGRQLSGNEAQVWVPNQEMELVMEGPYATLEISVSSDLADQLGWKVSGEPVKLISSEAKAKLVRTCSRATQAVAALTSTTSWSGQGYERISTTGDHHHASDILLDLWRDQILDDLGEALNPWLLAVSFGDQQSLAGTREYDLVRLAERLVQENLGGRPVRSNELADMAGVQPRALFQAFNKVRGIGPRKYFELRRLFMLNANLRQADRTQTTVTEQAISLGFTEFGRTSQIYMRQFGEYPSDTLKR